jgi:hypothetical protein
MTERKASPGARAIFAAFARCEKAEETLRRNPPGTRYHHYARISLELERAHAKELTDARDAALWVYEVV